MSYSLRYDPQHPLAGKKGYVAVHRAVLYEKIGPGTHNCHVCGKPISWSLNPKDVMMGSSLTADHLNFDRTDNRPENLGAACGVCNIHRRTAANLRRTAAWKYIPCEYCGEDFKSPITLAGKTTRKFCCMSCCTKNSWATGKITPMERKGLWELKSPYRGLVISGHPIGDKNGRIPEHRFVLFNKIGMGPHKCHWCSRDVVWGLDRKDPSRLVVDHLDNQKMNNAPENLVASCQHCNIRRAHFKNLIIDKPCEYCGKIFQVSKNRSIANPKYGRFCGRSCRTKFLNAQLGVWGKHIRDGEEFVVVSSDGQRARAIHLTCKQCGKDFLYAKSRYKPQFCCHECYGRSLIGVCPPNRVKKAEV